MQLREELVGAPCLRSRESNLPPLQLSQRLRGFVVEIVFGLRLCEWEAATKEVILWMRHVPGLKGDSRTS